MSSNTLERLNNIRDLNRMLDVVANQSKEDIVSGKKELVDIKEYFQLTFNIKENEQDVQVTKNIYEVITNRSGTFWHELYDDQGNLLNELTDEQFQKGKILTDLGEASFDENSLMGKVYSNESSKSLLELENEQNDDISKVLNMNKEDIKDLGIIQIDCSKDVPVSEKALEAKKQLSLLANLGFSIDSNQLATSKETIKEFLNIDADNLLIVKVNSEWKAIKVNDDGSMEVENNLQISDSSKSFSTIGRDSNLETHVPNIEFRREDNPDYSLAIDTNKENKTQAFLVAGDSRTALEIESQSIQSPYADVKNNELLLQAEQNPNEQELTGTEDKDIHEPNEPSLENSHIY